jgi:hypothetical protein
MTCESCYDCSMGSLLIDYPDAIEFVSEILDRRAFKKALQTIVEFLSSKGVQCVHIDFGFSLKRDLKGEPQLDSRLVPLAELEGVVETGLNDGEIEWNGSSDFLFSAVGAEMRCMLCSDADLHLASVDRALLMELAGLLRMFGIIIYDDGVPIQCGGSEVR